MLKVKGLAEGQDMSHVDNSQVCHETEVQEKTFNGNFLTGQAIIDRVIAAFL
jgi:hypothetical protein